MPVVCKTNQAGNRGMHGTTTILQPGMGRGSYTHLMRGPLRSPRCMPLPATCSAASSRQRSAAAVPHQSHRCGLQSLPLHLALGQVNAGFRRLRLQAQQRPGQLVPPLLPQVTPALVLPCWRRPAVADPAGHPRQLLPALPAQDVALGLAQLAQLAQQGYQIGGQQAGPAPLPKRRAVLPCAA